MSTTVREKTQSYQFQIWERLRLTVGEEGREGVYSCRVSDIRPDRLVISRPVYERGKTLMADNRRVTVYSTRADAAYALSARIRETQPKSADEMHLIELGPVKRVQRRRFVRLDRIVRLRYAITPRPVAEPVDLESPAMFESQSINLSAGGLLITTQNTVDPGEILLMNLENSGFEKLPSRILGACRYSGKTDNHPAVAGIEFILHEDLPRYFTADEINRIPAEAVRFDDQMQNNLVAEIFAEQLMMRQKGIL